MTIERKTNPDAQSVKPQPPPYTSEPDRQLIEGYLAWKWRSQAHLDAAHPYKSWIPGEQPQPMKKRLDKKRG